MFKSFILIVLVCTAGLTESFTKSKKILLNEMGIVLKDLGL